jgi:hypothetical protein
MSNWAELDENNVVVRVVVGDNNDPNGDEGYQWILTNLGGTWIKTSYNAKLNGFRKNFAGEGYTYNEKLDAFIAPKPFDSWILDEEAAAYVAPIPKPEDGLLYEWDEENRAWTALRSSDQINLEGN